MKAKKVTRGEYQRCAMNICNYLLRTPAFDRMLHGDSKLDQDLSDFRFEGGEVVTKTLEWAIGDEGKGSLDGKLLDNTKGGLNLISTPRKGERNIRAFHYLPGISRGGRGGSDSGNCFPGIR